jgi:hypothetical protein
MSRIKLIVPGIKVLIVAVVVMFSIFLACGDALAMFCSKCGKDIADDSVFCKYCGFKMGGGPGNSGGVDRVKLGKDLLDASSKGDVGKVRSLVAAGGDINVRDKNGDSSLEHAADKGCLDIVKFLVEKGAEVNNYNVDNWTPLMSACNRGYFEVVKFLMENGANINFATRFGKLGERTPLMQAAFCGHEEIVKLLVEKGADAGHINKKGETALSLASARGNKNIVSFLEGGAGDSFGKTFGPVDPDKLESVYEKFGDIYLAFKNGTVEKITSGGCCGFPALSPDKKFLCFVRTFPGVIVEMPCGEIEVTNLYAADLSTSGRPYLILRGSRTLAGEASKVDVGIMEPQFSLNGSKIYFMCSYAATSNAVKSVDLKSRIVKFLTDGISLRLIYSGNYSGHFISARHKYDGQDGARDVYCLMSPDGEEVREISVEFADVEKEFFNGK